MGIGYVVARGEGAREFSLPPLGPAGSPAGVGVEADAVVADVPAGTSVVVRVKDDAFVGLGDVSVGFAFDFVFLVGFSVIDERQLLRPAGVEGVVGVFDVAFKGRPRLVFTGPGDSFRCRNNRRSARRCAASAFATFSSSCAILAVSPVASGLESPSLPGASAISIAFSAFVSS